MVCILIMLALKLLLIFFILLLCCCCVFLFFISFALILFITKAVSMNIDECLHGNASMTLSIYVLSNSQMFKSLTIWHYSPYITQTGKITDFRFDVKLFRIYSMCILFLLLKIIRAANYFFALFVQYYSLCFAETFPSNFFENTIVDTYKTYHVLYKKQ